MRPLSYWFALLLSIVLSLIACEGLRDLIPWWGNFFVGFCITWTIMDVFYYRRWGRAAMRERA